MGALIGAYTVWDAQLVARLAVPPLVVEWVLDVAIALYVTPAALRDRRALGVAWRDHRGAALGTHALSEGEPLRRLAAAGAISLGVALLALG